MTKNFYPLFPTLSHRYYSNVANPTPELNQSTAFLLTVEQALDDAAHYIDTLKKEVGSTQSYACCLGETLIVLYIASLLFRFPFLPII